MLRIEGSIVMKRNDLIEFIIDISNKYFSYNIEEFKSLNENRKFWGIGKTIGNIKNYIVFLDEENFNNVDISFLYNNKDNREIFKKIIKILVVDKSKENANWQAIAENFQEDLIVLQENGEKLLYYTEQSKDVAIEIENVLNYKKRLELEKDRKRHNKDNKVTKILILINIIMYAVTIYLSYNINNDLIVSLLDGDIRALFLLGANESSAVSSGEYYRLITSMFLHGGLIHLAVNMYSLNILGPVIEGGFGKVKYLAIYFIGGIVGSIGSHLFTKGISIGASGAIFALLGAALVLSLRIKTSRGKSMVKNIIYIIAVNIFMGFAMPNIDNFAHLGGLVGGSLTAFVLLYKK